MPTQKEGEERCWKKKRGARDQRQRKKREAGLREKRQREKKKKKLLRQRDRNLIKKLLFFMSLLQQQIAKDGILLQLSC